MSLYSTFKGYRDSIDYQDIFRASVQMCLNTAKLVMISADYHDIERLLLLMIIVSSKNCSISIIDKKNITINRLIAHPYIALSF